MSMIEPVGEVPSELLERAFEEQPGQCRQKDRGRSE